MYESLEVLEDVSEKSVFFHISVFAEAWEKKSKLPLAVSTE